MGEGADAGGAPPPRNKDKDKDKEKDKDKACFLKTLRVFKMFTLIKYIDICI